MTTQRKCGFCLKLALKVLKHLLGQTAEKSVQLGRVQVMRYDGVSTAFRPDLLANRRNRCSA